MIWRLFILFTVIPALELYLLLQIGAVVGPLATVWIILVTGSAGAWLARREGLAVVTQLTRDLESGVPPASRVVEGFLVLAGGLLLVTPGVLTDAFGFALIVPFTRRALAPFVLKQVTSRVTVQTFGNGVHSAGFSHRPPESPDDQPSTLPFDHPVK